jgi:hypothetical protein
MSWNIDKAQAKVAKLQIGKPKIDRDASTFLFRQAVGISTS